MKQFKYTEKDKDLFLALNQSEVGQQLLDLMERLGDYLCDVRNIGNPFSEQGKVELSAALKATEVLQELIYKPIKTSHTKGDPDVNEYS